jgi:crossover junction endodeoxyribonuclease RusA
MSQASLYLPWPDKRLSPNSRQHWAALAKAKKKAKADAYHLALEAGLGKIEADTVLVRYSFFPPSRRAYDLDNLIASMKAAADGIAMAIEVDDSKWNIAISPHGPVEKHGMVKVDIEWGHKEEQAA